MDGYRRISSDQLREKQRRGEQLAMLDLRTPAEFELEHIQGSINIPLDTLQTEDLAKMYEGKTIFLICGTGKLAYTAAAKFHDYGYFDVTVIAGGLLAWRVLGYPLARLK